MPYEGFWTAVRLGGTTGALDKIDGDDLSDKDMAALLESTDTARFYWLDDDASGSEGETVINPDTNAGTKSWLLLGITLPNTGLHILDTDEDFDLIIKPGSDLSADRTLTLTTGDAARTITFSGNPTLADWFDQAVKAASTPAFAGLSLTGNLVLAANSIIGTSVDISNVELQQLSLIGATTISANQWAALGGIAETLTGAELNILDGVTGVTAAELSYIGDVTGLIQAQLDARCLESVFGASIGASLLLDTTVLKASAILQKYHAIDPAADVQSLLGCADEAAIRTLLDLEAGTDFYSKSAEDTWRNSVSQTEMGYVDGVTSDIQTQFTARANKTTASWSKTIGTNGQDYADWATMIAAIPDLIAHAVTVTIKAGTTLTERCDLFNRHGITSIGLITIQAEKYYPTGTTQIPTADSATTTTLRDAELATAALGDDYFNGCWVLVCDGTGTDNGFVEITDYVDATGDVVVASWPGTQPDNTSRYLIVGALVDGGGTSAYYLRVHQTTAVVNLYGIGFVDSTFVGLEISKTQYVNIRHCGFYSAASRNVYVKDTIEIDFQHNGVVGSGNQPGINCYNVGYSYMRYNGVSDNNTYGILVQGNSYGYLRDSFGDGNGTWGTYLQYDAQVRIIGGECSGSSGDHSDPKTADTDSADQAAAH